MRHACSGVLNSNEFRSKAIKYLALALAIFLSVSIIGGIITGLTGVSYILSDRHHEAVGEMQVYPIEGEISSLSLSLSGAELTIKTADNFSVESNHRYISAGSEGGRLCISETKRLFSVYPTFPCNDGAVICPGTQCRLTIH